MHKLNMRKVSYRRCNRHTGKEIPCIILEYLEQWGFPLGTFYSVKYAAGKIIIIKQRRPPENPV